MNCRTVQFERFPLLAKEGNVLPCNSFTASDAPGLNSVAASRLILLRGTGLRVPACGIGKFFEVRAAHKLPGQVLRIFNHGGDEE